MGPPSFVAPTASPAEPAQKSCPNVELLAKSGKFYACAPHQVGVDTFLSPPPRHSTYPSAPVSSLRSLYRGAMRATDFEAHISAQFAPLSMLNMSADYYQVDRVARLLVTDFLTAQFVDSNERDAAEQRLRVALGGLVLASGAVERFVESKLNGSSAAVHLKEALGKPRLVERLTLILEDKLFATIEGKDEDGSDKKPRYYDLTRAHDSSLIAWIRAQLFAGEPFSRFYTACRSLERELRDTGTTNSFDELSLSALNSRFGLDEGADPVTSEVFGVDAETASAAVERMSRESPRDRSRVRLNILLEHADVLPAVRPLRKSDRDAIQAALRADPKLAYLSVHVWYQRVHEQRTDLPLPQGVAEAMVSLWDDQTRGSAEILLDNSALWSEELALSATAPLRRPAKVIIDRFHTRVRNAAPDEAWKMLSYPLASAYIASEFSATSVYAAMDDAERAAAEHLAAETAATLDDFLALACERPNTPMGASPAQVLGHLRQIAEEALEEYESYQARNRERTAKRKARKAQEVSA